MFNRGFLAGILALAALSVPGQEPTYTFRRICKPGLSRTYRSRAELTIDTQPVQYEGKVTEKVVSIESDGSIILDIFQSDAKMTVEGEVRTSPDQAPLTHRYSPRGVLLSLKGNSTGSAAYRQSILLGQVIAPEQPVKLGATWTETLKGDPKLGTNDTKVEFKALQLESVGGLETVRLTRTAEEVTGPKPAKVVETVWLNVADFSLVKSDTTVTNLPLEGSEAVMSGHLVQELADLNLQAPKG